MGHADSLSRKDDIETGDDNREITLLKGKDQYFHIQAIDVVLAKKISSLMAEDPIISKALAVTVEEPPIPFSPFSLTDCTLLNHFSFEDFVAVAFPDIAGDLDIQI